MPPGSANLGIGNRHPGTKKQNAYHEGTKVSKKSEKKQTCAKKSSNWRMFQHGRSWQERITNSHRDRVPY